MGIHLWIIPDYLRKYSKIPYSLIHFILIACELSLANHFFLLLPLLEISVLISISISLTSVVILCGSGIRGFVHGYSGEGVGVIHVITLLACCFIHSVQPKTIETSGMNSQSALNHTINPTRNGMNVKSFYISCASTMRAGYCGR
jgi:hypothetical protein